MKFYLLLLSTFLMFNIFSQTERKVNDIKFSPLRLAGIFRSTLELTYERQTNDYFSTQIGIGYIFQKKMFGSLPEKNRKGFTIELEERYYLDGDVAYFAVSLFYLNENYTITKRFVDENFEPYGEYSEEGVYSDEFFLDKKIVKPSFKMGAKHITKINLVFDFNIGIGAKYKIVKHTDREQLNDRIYTRQHDFGNGLYQKGEFWSPNLIWNVKIGYQF